MTVLTRSIGDRRRSLLWWSVSIALTILVTMLVFPSFEGRSEVDEVFADMPEGVRAAFGLGDDVPLTSPAGYVQSQLVASLLPILLLVFGIGAGARAVGGIEEDGTLELLLTNPVSRRRVALERFAGVAVQLALLGVVCTLATAASAAAVGALDGLSGGGLVGALASATMLAVLYAALAFAIGAWRGRRGIALSVASGAAVSGYLVETLGQSVPALDGARNVSPWHWFLDHNMLVDGWSPAAVVIPVIVATTFAIAGTLALRRRDLH